MKKTQRRSYIEGNPYHTWVYRDDNSKFVGHFKNKQDAKDWARRTHSELGKTTTASSSQPLHKRRQPSLFGLNPNQGMLGYGFNGPNIFKPRTKSRNKNPFGWNF